MNSGHAFDIKHPEMIRVSRSTVYVFFPDNPEAPFDRAEMISMLLIERVEPLESVANTGKS